MRTVSLIYCNSVTFNKASHIYFLLLMIQTDQATSKVFTVDTLQLNGIKPLKLSFKCDRKKFAQ